MMKHLSLFIIVSLLIIHLPFQSYSDEIQNDLKSIPAEISDSDLDIDWNTTDPMGLIKILQKTGKYCITIKKAPKGWIRKKHVDQLMKLIDSKEPAVPVCSVFSSFSPINETSTIGNEAMFIIEGFKKGTYPPFLCSVHYFKGDPVGYRNWYRSQK